MLILWPFETVWREAILLYEMATHFYGIPLALGCFAVSILVALNVLLKNVLGCNNVKVIANVQVKDNWLASLLLVEEHNSRKL